MLLDIKIVGSASTLGEFVQMGDVDLVSKAGAKNKSASSSLGGDGVDPVVSDAKTEFSDSSPKLSATRLAANLGRWWSGFENLLENRRTPSVLISLTAHLLVLILLALMSMPTQFGFLRDDGSGLSLSLAADSQWMEADLQLTDDSDPAPPQPLPLNAEVSKEVQETVAFPQLNSLPLLTLDGNLATNQLTNPTQEKLQAINHQTLVARFSDTGIDGRRAKNRTELAIQRGGSLESERAVEAALEWLAAHQAPSGGWSLLHDQGDCNGRCSHPGSPGRFDPAATSLSLLAFLGAGYTHMDGKYQQNVRRAIYFLRQIAEETPKGTSFLQHSDRGMYNHGITAFALCEAYQLTKDEDLKEVCQKVIDFIVSAQSYQGGWGYLPRQPGDLTISGWQMMALKSAVAADLDVPPVTVWKTVHFLNSQMAEDQVTYFYRVPQDRSMTCTAIGVMMRMFLGQTWTDPNIIEALRRISEHDDRGKDIYFRYYATLALFHAGGPMWEKWNAKCRDYLISTQATSGHEAGSWYFDDHFGKEGGRLYTTAMAAMTLEVYYRFNPLYQQADRPFEL